MWLKRKRRKAKNNRRPSLGNGFGRRAMFERLEGRNLLSAGNVFAEFVGLLSPADNVEHIEVSVAPAEFSLAHDLSLARDKAILGFRLKAVEGSSFDPAELQIGNTAGAATVLYARADLPGKSDSLVIAELAGGGYSLDVSGGLDTRSQFRLEVFLVGDVDGNHVVDRGDLNRIRQSYGAREGTSRYNVTADANLDGRITAFDLSMARRNAQYGRPLIGPVQMTATDSIFSSPLVLTSATAATPGNIYDRVAAVVPAEGYEPNAAMQFFESASGWVQPLASMLEPEGGVHTVPGEGTASTTIIVDWFYREAGYGNDLLLYTVDDDNGKIGSLSPGDAGYLAAAAGRVQGTLNSLDCASMANPNHQNDVPAASPLSVSMQAGTKFSFYLIQGSYENVTPKNYKWFPFIAANVDNYSHFQEVTTSASGAGWYNNWDQNLFAYKLEDLSNDTENYPNPAGFDNDADFDDVIFTVSARYANLTAYRPQHEDDNDNYAPFAKTVVDEEDEEDTDKGPGIRINGDDDNENSTPDRSDSQSVTDENDLIEVLIKRSNASENFKLRRSSQNIKVWTTRTKGTAILFNNDNDLETDNLPFSSGEEELTVWVEWIDSDHGTTELSVKSSTGGVVTDKLKFHTFHSIVVFLGGLNQDPSDPADANHGMFQIAIDMYRIGYDVWMHNENNVANNGTGAAYNEVMQAYSDRGATNVAIQGYSKGGGATYDLVGALFDSNEDIEVKYSGYCDAVASATGWASEERWPRGSLYHQNIYQTTGGIDGEPTEGLLAGDDEYCADNWTPSVTHYTVDDHTQTKSYIKNKLESKLPNR